MRDASAALHKNVVSSIALGFILFLLAIATACGGVTSNSSTGGSKGTDAAPVISNASASTIGTTSATITWDTDIASSSQVDFGLSTSYGQQTALDATTVTSHSQTLSGLTAATTYHFRVRSSASNLESVSSDFSFTTSGSATVVSVTLSPTTA